MTQRKIQAFALQTANATTHGKSTWTASLSQMIKRAVVYANRWLLNFTVTDKTARTIGWALAMAVIAANTAGQPLIHATFTHLRKCAAVQLPNSNTATTSALIFMMEVAVRTATPVWWQQTNSPVNLRVVALLGQTVRSSGVISPLQILQLVFAAQTARNAAGPGSWSTSMGLWAPLQLIVATTGE